MYKNIKKTYSNKKGVCFLKIFMFKSKKRREEKQNKENLLIKEIDKLNHNLLESNLVDIATLLGNRKKLMFTNLIAGISRGVGIGIGVTLISAILVFILQKIVTLNIPVIGEYIADIVDIVQKSI